MKKASLLKLNSIALNIFLCLTGCGEIDCPAFPDESVYWLPYSTGDTIKLSNDSNTTISLPISQLNITDSYSFSKRCDCICEAALSIKTNMDTINLISLNASIIYANGINLKQPLPIEVRIEIYKKVKELIIPMQHDEFYCNEYSNWDLQDSAFLDEKYYKNVLIINNSKNSKFHKLTLVKGTGIIQITDIESNVWKVTSNE